MKLTRLLRARGRANVSPKRLRLSVLQADLQPVHGAEGGEQVWHLTRFLAQSMRRLLSYLARLMVSFTQAYGPCTGQLVKFKFA